MLFTAQREQRWQRWLWYACGSAGHGALAGCAAALDPALQLLLLLLLLLLGAARHAGPQAGRHPSRATRSRVACACACMHDSVHTKMQHHNPITDNKHHLWERRWKSSLSIHIQQGYYHLFLTLASSSNKSTPCISRTS